MTRERLNRFQSYLASHQLDGAIVRRPANVLYLTGFPAGYERPAFAALAHLVGRDRVAFGLTRGPSSYCTTRERV